MKQFKVLVALVLAMMLMVSVASAATITINRHSSWNDPDVDPVSLKATYTWHRIFDVDLTDADHPVYTISGTDAADKVAALDSSIFEAKQAADSKYYITLKSGVQDAAVFAALATMVADNATLFPGTDVTSDANPVTLDVGDPGYFYIEASNGKNVAVQTTGTVTIDEKNDYPTIDKKQKKANGTYADTELPAEIGTYIDYQVTVSVPADANKDIVVVDTMTEGLDYDENTGLTLSPNVAFSEVASTDAGYNASADWQIKFTPTQYANYLGQDIVITFRAQITAAALTDTGRENEVTLTYDNGNYVVTDHVNYTPYFGGIEKVDGANNNIKLDGVKFNVTVGNAAFNVTPVYGTGDNANTVLYYIPGGDSNEVVTGDNGLIIIRGLDNDKTYTLTETDTKDGYNLLDAPKNLTLAEDTGTAYTTTTFDKVENNKGAVLPSTGGIGTTIFYVAGIVLVLGAAAVIIARRKSEQE